MRRLLDPRPGAKHKNWQTSFETLPLQVKSLLAQDHLGLPKIT